MCGIWTWVSGMVCSNLRPLHTRLVLIIFCLLTPTQNHPRTKYSMSYLLNQASYPERQPAVTSFQPQQAPKLQTRAPIPKTGRENSLVCSGLKSQKPVRLWSFWLEFWFCPHFLVSWQSMISSRWSELRKPALSHVSSYLI